MKEYRLLIFDADGTLFNFDKAESYALEKCLVYFDRKYDSEIYLRNYREINNKIWKDFEKGLITAEELKVERFRRFIMRIKEDIKAELFAEKYLEFLSEAVFLIDGVDDLVADLSRKYRMVILTNGLAKVQRKRWSLTSIRKNFEDIVISEEIGIAKPDPQIFKHLLDKINYNIANKDKVLIIGDSISSDIQGGINFGIDTCWYNPHKILVPDQVKPTYQIEQITELKQILS